MSIRITGDKRECRILIRDVYEMSKARDAEEDFCGRESIAVMPDDIVRNNLGYELIFQNRRSLKEFLCFDGFDEKDFKNLVVHIGKVFEAAERNGINPYSFVFDVSCIFVEGDGKKYSFVYTPDCINNKNNGVGDLISLVSLYSGFETDSPNELYMRSVMEKIRGWEKDYYEKGEISYDFPVESIGNYLPEKKRDGKMFCIVGRKPIILKSSSCGDKDYVCRIGRDTKWATIKCSSYFAGRHHGEITFEDENFVYRDMSSVNGTVINGKKAVPNQKYILKGISKIEIAGEKSMFFFRLA